MNTVPFKSAILKEKPGTLRRALAAIAIGTILLASVMSGCQPAPSLEEVIVPKAAMSLADMTMARVNAWNGEIARIDAQLTEAYNRMHKVEQVGEPALKWIQLMKERAVRESWTTRTLEVMGDLSKLKNDQYQVVKLQFISEFLSSGIGHSRIILVADLGTGQTTEYDELVDSFKRKIADLTFQRETIVKAMTLARSTALSALEQSRNWKVAKVNPTTYTVRGPGLGMQQGLTSGQWTYYTDSEKMVPNDQAAAALQKTLTGK